MSDEQPQAAPVNGAGPSQKEFMMVNAIAKAVAAGNQTAIINALRTPFPVVIGEDEITHEPQYQNVTPIQLLYDLASELMENNRNARIANGNPYDEDLDDEDEEEPAPRKKKSKRR